MSAYDAIVVGAGIQGAAMALEIARRGLRPLVLERDDPGCGTTCASFGIVHGGLRHLQRLHFSRWFLSRRELAWFLNEFPELVRPLACVMPLYSGTLRSRTLFRAAFLAERALSSHVHPLPRGTLLEPGEVVPGFPIPRTGLIGAACWYDAVLADAPGAVHAILQRAARDGGACLERTEATDLLVHNGRVTGVQARRLDESSATEVHAPVVIICAGGATRKLARRFDRDRPQLSTAVLAFNLILDLPAPPGVTLAVSPVPGRGRSCFMRAHEGGLLVGTWYAPWSENRTVDVPDELILHALSDVRRCLPGVLCTEKSIRRVMAGVLPDTDGSGRALRNREVFIDHGRSGGPRGLYSVLGVKLTMARAVAHRAAQHIWPGRTSLVTPRKTSTPVSGVTSG